MRHWKTLLISYCPKDWTVRDILIYLESNYVYVTATEVLSNCRGPLMLGDLSDEELEDVEIFIRLNNNNLYSSYLISKAYEN